MKMIQFFFVFAWCMIGHDADAKRRGQQYDFYGMSGCGPGSLIFENNDKGTQLLSYFVDAWTGIRGLALTSSTSGCDKREGIDTPELAELFIDEQRHALAREVVMGEGPSLTSLSNLMQCKNPSSLRQFMKQHGENFMTLSGKSWVQLIQGNSELACLSTKGSV